MKESQGGLFIPETAVISIPKDGLWFALIRYIGSLVIQAGSWIYLLGHEKKEIHPRQALWHILGRHL